MYLKTSFVYLRKVMQFMRNGRGCSFVEGYAKQKIVTLVSSMSNMRLATHLMLSSHTKARSMLLKSSQLTHTSS